MKKLQIAVCLLIVLSLLPVSAVCADEEKLAPPEQQVYRYSSASAIIGFNPILNTTGPDNGAQNIVFETLVRLVPVENDESAIEPGIAESWDVSEDGKTYTFHLRENAKWSDGVPNTAQDFEFTYRKMADPATASTNAFLLDGVIVNFSESLYNDGKSEAYNKKPEDIGVRALDEHTLEIQLEKPFSYFLELLSGIKPIREDLYNKYKNEYGSSIEKTVFNGAFVVETWESNTHVHYVKNPEYWNAENVVLERIEMNIIAETQTAVQALMSGQIDVVGTADPNWQQLIENAGQYSKWNIPDAAPEFYSFNGSNVYFKHPKIRQAFMLAYDRERMVEEVLNGLGMPLESMIPDVIQVGNKPYHELVKNENYFVSALKEKYPDPKALLVEGLTEAGLDPDPAKMEVTLSSRGTTEFSKTLAEWMIQEWRKNLGVEVKIDMLEWNIMWDRVDEGNYDIVTSGWGPYYNDPNGLLSIFHPVDGFFDAKKSGWTGEDSENFAKILEKAEEIVDPEEKAKAYLEAETLLVGSALISPSYVGMSNFYVANYVAGYNSAPFAMTDYSKIRILEH